MSGGKVTKNIPLRPDTGGRGRRVGNVRNMGRQNLGANSKTTRQNLVQNSQIVAQEQAWTVMGPWAFG